MKFASKLHDRAFIAFAVMVVPHMCMGCARIVTLDPEEVSRRNSQSWTIRKTPPAPSKPVVAVEPEGAVSESATVPTAPPQESPSAAVPTTDAVASGLPFRARPEVAAALRSAPDPFGIPNGLYDLDPLLVAHRREIELQARERHSVAGGLVVAGLGEMALGTLLFLMAAQSEARAEAQRQQGATMVNDPSDVMYGWGILTGVLGLGSIGTAAGFALTRPDPGQLQRHFQETYQRQPP